MFVFLDGDGVEHHRFLGYLPPDEFSAQVEFAHGRRAFNTGRYDEALKRYQTVVEKYPATDAAPESLYWTGVCEFKLTKDGQKITTACREVVRRYPGHIWAKKLGFSR
jgi:TolA-binding protein